MDTPEHVDDMAMAPSGSSYLPLPFTGHPFLDAVAKVARKYEWNIPELSRIIGMSRYAVWSYFKGRKHYTAEFIHAAIGALEDDDAMEVTTALYKSIRAGYDRKAPQERSVRAGALQPKT